MLLFTYTPYLVTGNHDLPEWQVKCWTPSIWRIKFKCSLSIILAIHDDTVNWSLLQWSYFINFKYKFIIYYSVFCLLWYFWRSYYMYVCQNNLYSVKIPKYNVIRKCNSTVCKLLFTSYINKFKICFTTKIIIWKYI